MSLADFAARLPSRSFTGSFSTTINFAKQGHENRGAEEVRILVLSPKIPQFRGMGVNMRAGMHVESLVSFAEVHAIVVSYDLLLDFDGIVSNLTKTDAKIEYFAMKNLRSRLFFESTREKHGIVRLLKRLASGPLELVSPSRVEVRTLHAALKGAQFDVILAFRLSMASAALQVKDMLGTAGHRPAAVLDLDDIDSLRMERTASTVAAGRLWSWLGRMHARRVRQKEDELVPKFDRVYVCSDVDAGRLRERYKNSNIHVLPNAINLPVRTNRNTPAAGSAPTIGFVGSMDYAPNVDAVLYFYAEVLPRIRAELRQAIRFIVVGRNPPPQILRLDGTDGVEVTGTVVDIAPYYEIFDVAIAPLRSGGGTRIKILEAFGFECPVVSTSVGAEGIEAREGESILIADDPESFAAHCIELLNNRVLRNELGRAGRELVLERYSAEAIGRVMQGSLSDLLKGRRQIGAGTH